MVEKTRGLDKGISDWTDRERIVFLLEIRNGKKRPCIQTR
jgi:hypothetical protein